MDESVVIIKSMKNPVIVFPHSQKGQLPVCQCEPITGFLIIQGGSASYVPGTFRTLKLSSTAVLIIHPNSSFFNFSVPRPRTGNGQNRHSRKIHVIHPASVISNPKQPKNLIFADSILLIF